MMALLKRVSLLALWSWCVVFPADEFRTFGEKNGYDPKLLTDYLNLSSQRALLDLNGEWSITADGISRTIVVPSCYEYAGKVTYKRTFVPGPEFQNKHFRLMSFGINFRVDIRINGEFVTNANTAYIGLETDIPEDLIRVGETNTIEITVDSELDAHTTFPRKLTLLQPQWYGGIFREIFLIGIPKVAVERWSLSYNVSSDLRKCDFTMQLNFRNYEYSLRLVDSLKLTSAKEPFRYIVELFDENEPEPVYTNRFKRYKNVWDIPKIREQNPEDTVSIRNFASRTLHFSVDKPVFWSPLTPGRYRGVVYLVQGYEIVDQINFTCGIAQTDVHDQFVFLNSQPTTIRGVEYYEDYPGSGNTVSYAVLEQDILKIKRLGANTIYFRHHMPHPYFLELCSRYGLLVFAEMPAWRMTENVHNDAAYLEDLRKYVRNMVQLYRGFPSLISWGLASGPDNEDHSANHYFSQIVPVVKAIDSRPVFATSAFGGSDSFMDNVDIILLDLKNHNLLSANLFINRGLSKWPNRALVCIYGAQVFSNNQNGYSDPMSTKFQAKLIVDVQKKLIEWKLAGGLIRSYNDYRVQRSYMYANPNADPVVYTSGLVTFDRNDRFAYDIARALYNDDTMEPIALGSFERTYSKTFPIVGLILVVVFVSFYRQSGRFRNSVHRSITKVVSFFTDVRENRVITLWPALLNAVLCSLALGSLVSVIFFELRRNQIFDEWMAALIPSPGLKSWLDGMAWSPEAFVFQFTILYMFIYLILALVLKAAAKAFYSPFSFQQAVIASCWSGAHMLLLIPFVIVFHRLLYLDFFLTLAMLLAIGSFLWHWVRFFRLAKVVYDAGWWRTGLIFGSAMALLIMLVGMYYSRHYDTFHVTDYIEKIYTTRNYSGE